MPPLNHEQDSHNITPVNTWNWLYQPQELYAFLVYTDGMNTMFPPCIHIPLIPCFPCVYRWHEQHHASPCMHIPPCTHMPRSPCFPCVYWPHELYAFPSPPEVLPHSNGVCLSALPVLHFGAVKQKHGYLKQAVILWQPVWHLRWLLHD